MLKNGKRRRVEKRLMQNESCETNTSFLSNRHMADSQSAFVAKVARSLNGTLTVFQIKIPTTITALSIQQRSDHNRIRFCLKISTFLHIAIARRQIL